MQPSVIHIIYCSPTKKVSTSSITTQSCLNALNTRNTYTPVIDIKHLSILELYESRKKSYKFDNIILQRPNIWDKLTTSNHNVIRVTGFRRSGKTLAVRTKFPDAIYINSDELG